MVREAYCRANCQLALAHARVWAGTVSVSWTWPNTQWAFIKFGITVRIFGANGCLTQTRQQFPHMSLLKGVVDVQRADPECPGRHR